MAKKEPQDETGTGGKVTIREVAKLAGVSVGTVSRVLNMPDRASPDARAAVERAVAALGYQVNAIARSMRTHATRAVGLLVHDIRNPIFAAVAQAAQESLSRAGYLLVLTGSDGAGTSDPKLIAMLHQRRMDGLIAFLRNETDPEVERALALFGGRAVLVDRDTRARADVVISDHAAGMTLATEHLFDLGHRRIGFITGAGHILPGRERVAGFTNAHDRRHVALDRELIRMGSLQAEYGYRETFALLDSAAPPTALIAGGNQLLEGVIAALKTRGVRIPHDLSLIGFDDTPLAALGTPSITVVRRDMVATGHTAAELLLGRMGGEQSQAPRRVVLATELILRESTAPV